MMSEAIPAAVLDRSVTGLRLAGRPEAQGSTLGEVIGAGPTLLVFLRHFG